MLPTKITRWLEQKKLPPRLLLSGSGDLLSLGKELAAQTLNQPLSSISSGLNPDVKIAADDDQSLKIGDAQSPDEMSVRGLIKWLYQTPVAKARILVLENMERTSRDAMQAWLKVLEEPPGRAQFILTTKNHYLLPETILSRVTIVPIPRDMSPVNFSTQAPDFLESNDLISRFQMIEALDKNYKEDPKGLTLFLEELIVLARSEPARQNLLPLLFETYQDIQRNVNRRLTLEHLALKLQNR